MKKKLRLTCCAAENDTVVLYCREQRLELHFDCWREDNDGRSELRLELHLQDAMPILAALRDWSGATGENLFTSGKLSGTLDHQTPLDALTLELTADEAQDNVWLKCSWSETALGVQLDRAARQDLAVYLEHISATQSCNRPDLPRFGL